MSVRVLSKVWEGYPGDSSVELLALLALADWSDDEGRSWPSTAKIARKCRVSPRQAQRIISRLIAAELVAITAGAKGGPPGTKRRFKINCQKLTGDINVANEELTGDSNDAEGCHLRRERDDGNVTQYTKDTSKNRHTSGDGFSNETTKPETPIDEDFEKFKNAYPNKEGMYAALKVWKKIKPPIDEVLKALKWQKNSQKWEKGFIPSAKRYLEERRWQDEPEKASWETDYRDT